MKKKWQASNLQSNVRAHKHYVISCGDVRAQVGETLGRDFGIRLKRREDDDPAVMAPEDGAKRCILNAEKLQDCVREWAASARQSGHAGSSSRVQNKAFTGMLSDG